MLWQPANRVAKEHISSRQKTWRLIRNPADLPKAAGFYEKVLKSNPLHLDANNRLMVVYRKLGDSTKELRTIKNAIKAYQERIDKDRKAWILDHEAKAKDSAKLAEAMGLLDAKGQPAYQNEILTAWTNRLALLEARIKKNQIIRARLTAKQKAKRNKI